MTISNLQSQVDQVQSLLSALQNSLTQLPIQQQNQVSLELERVAAQLRDCLPSAAPAQEPREIPHTSANGAFGALVVSEPWLGLALKQAKTGAWKLDLMNSTVKWSTGLYALVGINPAEETINPHTFFELTHPDDREIVDRKFQQAVEQGGPFYQEFRIVRRDGKIIWVNSVGTVEHDASGRAVQAAGINQDITDRKQAEQALRESEERERAKVDELEALMDAVPAIIWISRDPQCKEMLGNRYGYQFLEMWQGANLSKTAPDEDLARQPYRNFKDGREIPGSEMPMQIAAATGMGVIDYEFTLVFENGVQKNLLGNVIPLIDAAGKPSGAVGAFVDITRRKQAEEELRQRERQLRAWKERLSLWSKATNSFFWNLAADGSYQEVSFVEPYISGKPFDQTQGWGWMTTIHPEDRETLRSSWQNAIIQQKAFDIESRLWHAVSEQYRWFSHRAVPILNEGRLQGWVGASVDIQERKETENALRESELRFRVALASAPIVVFTMDKELRYTWVYNPRHRLSEEELLGKRGDETLPPEDVKAFTEVKQSVIKTGQAVQEEIKVKINNEWYSYIVTLDPLFDDQGQVSGIVGAALDITEQRRLETAQRENEIRVATQRHLLETRENERGKIAREIHDGPIQSLVSTMFVVQQLKEGVPDPGLIAELTPVGLGLKAAVQELRQIINELRPPILARFGLMRAIQRHVEDMDQKYPDLDLELELADGVNNLPEQVSLALYRVCQEALNNIIRHAHATKAVIRLSLDHDWAQLEIEDNGMGFSFTTDFSRLTAENHFGLAGMKERAEAIGGSLEVTSKPQNGTKIKVLVPVNR